MPNECFSGRTFHRLPQSEMIYREALLRTWVELHGHRSADARANDGSVLRKQQGRNAVNLSRRVNTGTPELVPGAEHIGNSSACTRQIEHSGRLWIEGAQRQQRVESWPVCFLTSRLPKYVSWRLDPEVLLSDALTINWTTFMGYAFSPFHFILAVLSKVSCDQADIILFAPLWKAQPWCHLSWVFWSIIQSFFPAWDTF